MRTAMDSIATEGSIKIEKSQHKYMFVSKEET